jgi:hypothetical protein
MKKSDNFDTRKWLVENKLTTQSRLNENKIPGVNVEVADDYIELSGDSGDYSGFIEDNGTISFSVIYEDEDDRDGMEFDDENWKGILGDDHVFVKIAKAIPTKVEALDDYVMITVKADDIIPPNQKTGSSKSIILTPLQKKEFLSAVRDLKRVEDLEYALGEAGNILANIITNGEAEYIEDVEDFGYDADEVENYAQELASSRR